MTASTRINMVAVCCMFVLATLPCRALAEQETRSVQYFIDSLFYPEYETDGYVEPGLCDPDSTAVSVDTIGQLSGHRIVELMFTCSDSGWCYEGKAILYQSGRSGYELLYYYINDCTEVYLQSASIDEVDSALVLSTRSRLTGTGGCVEERYWVWNDTSNRPENLQVEKVTSDVLSRVLPDNYYLAWGGFFDIGDLSLACYVRRPGDHNCCPTGGHIALRFQIKESTLSVVSCTYDPNRIDSSGESGH